MPINILNPHLLDRCEERFGSLIILLYLYSIIKNKLKLKVMYSLFVKEYLEIDINRSSYDDIIVLSIKSDYSDSQRKGQLYVNDDHIAEIVQTFWKSLKTTKKLSCYSEFGKIDWYDNMTDMYETPTFMIKKGLKKVRVGAIGHGSIPKDWSFEVVVRFKDMSRMTPVIEAIESAVGYHLNEKNWKQIKKELKPLFKKEKKYVCICFDEE